MARFTRIFVLLLAVGVPSAARAETLAEWLESAMTEINDQLGSASPCKNAMLVGGEIVQALGPKSYEVSYRLPMELWGNGDRDAGKAVTILLKTTRTKFTEKGSFDICVKPKVSYTKMKGADGFSRSVIVVTEEASKRAL
jgi:hypothetical protein